LLLYQITSLTDKSLSIRASVILSVNTTENYQTVTLDKNDELYALVKLLIFLIKIDRSNRWIICRQEKTQVQVWIKYFETKINDFILPSQNFLNHFISNFYDQHFWFSEVLNLVREI
jgi:hypothetical protein